LECGIEIEMCGYVQKNTHSNLKYLQKKQPQNDEFVGVYYKKRSICHHLITGPGSDRHAVVERETKAVDVVV